MYKNYTKTDGPLIVVGNEVSRFEGERVDLLPLIWNVPGITSTNEVFADNVLLWCLLIFDSVLQQKGTERERSV